MRLFDETAGIKHSSGLMQAKRTFCLLLSCGTAMLAHAQTDTTNQPPATNQPPPQTYEPAHMRRTHLMTLDECIKLALQHNFDIQIQQYNPIISQFALNISYGNYEPVFDFNANRAYNDRAGGINPQTGLPFPGNITDTDTYTPEVKGVLPTGLSYDLIANAQRNSIFNFPSNAPGGFLPPFWTSSTAITLTQPLLKNFWIDSTRLQIQLNKASLKISEAQFRQQLMTSITAVKSAYYNLLYGRDNVKAQQTAYQLAQQLVTENLKRVEVGALAPLDEKQSESQAATSLAALNLAEFQLGGYENTLKNLITDKYSDWVDVTIIPAEDLTAVPQDLNLQESWRRAVTQRPDMIEAKLNIEKQNVTLKYDFNQLFPELDISGTYSRNANQATFGESLEEIRKGDRSSYGYGAFVSVPLGGNYAARSQYKSAKATLKQLLLQLKQVEQNALIQVDNDVGNVASTLQQVYATRDARIYAQEALDAERKKLENGKSTSFVVLQLISNLTTARVQEIQALANYNISIAQLALDEGNTLEANHIQVNVK